MYGRNRQLSYGLYVLEQLAQQDLLRASASIDPIYWHQQALDRMETYRDLRIALRQNSIQAVVRRAQEQSDSLPPAGDGKAQLHGHRQALAMFLALAKEELRRAELEELRRRELEDSLGEPVEEYLTAVTSRA